MNNTTSLIRTLLVCIGALFISTKGSAQVIMSLDDCFKVYTSDTSIFRKLHVEKYLSVDTTTVKKDMYARALKSNTDPDLFIMKVVFNTTQRNQFMYSFKSPAQYGLLQDSLKSGKFTLLKSADQSGNNMQVQRDIYQLDDMFIILLKVASDAARYASYSLMIMTPTEEEKPFIR